jgi:hypothetical protein
VVEVDVPHDIDVMFEEGINILLDVLSEHVHDDFASLIYAWISDNELHLGR